MDPSDIAIDSLLGNDLYQEENERLARERDARGLVARARVALPLSDTTDSVRMLREEGQKQRAQQVVQQMDISLQAGPDTVAQRVQHFEKTGDPSGKRTFGLTPEEKADRVLKLARDPKLLNFMERYPAAAAVAADDAWLQGFSSRMLDLALAGPREFKRDTLMAEAGRAYARAVDISGFSRMTPEREAERLQLLAEADDYLTRARAIPITGDQDFIGTPSLEEAVGGIGQMFSMGFDMFLGGAKTAAPAALAGGALGTGVGLLGSAPAGPLAVGPALATGLGYAIFAGKTGFSIGSMRAMSMRLIGMHLMRLRDEGWDPDNFDTKVAAVTAGMTEAYLERLSWGLLWKFGGKKILIGAMPEAASRALGLQAANWVQRVGLGSVLKETALRTAASSLTEASEEFLQGTVAVGLGEFAGRVSQGMPIEQAWSLGWQKAKEGLPGAVNEAAAAASSVALLGGLFGPVTFYRATKIEKQAQVSEQFFEELQNGAATSKLFERSPKLASEFVDVVTQGTNRDTVYLDPNVLADALNSEGIDEIEANTVLPGISQQIADAREQGRRVAMPTKDFARAILNSNLMPHLRDHIAGAPDGLTNKQRQEALDAQTDAGTTESKDEALAVQAALDESAGIVGMRVADQLIASGQRTEEVAESEGQLVAARVRAVAAQLSEATGKLWSPEEVFDVYPLNVISKEQMQVIKQGQTEAAVLEEAKTPPSEDLSPETTGVPVAPGEQLPSTVDEELLPEDGRVLEEPTLEQPRKPKLTRQQRLLNEVPGLARVMPWLSEPERARLMKPTATALVQVFNELPSVAEVQAAALAGRVKKGWYRRSAKAIVQIFGVTDAPRFAALLASFSPQTSVESNLINALSIWKNWVKEGRPTDQNQIIEIFGKSVQGEKGVDSVLGAWIPNGILSLTAEDPTSIELSGFKVDSFMNNLREDVNRVTIDAWEALLLGEADANKISNVPNYLAGSALIRKAAAALTKLTGELWTPEEVQETTWSWAKALVEKAAAAGETRTLTEIVRQEALTEAEIAGTPDFANLFAEGVYRKLAQEAGLDPDAAASSRSSDVGDGGRATAEDLGLSRDRFQAALVRAARRIERTSKARAELNRAEKLAKRERERARVFERTVDLVRLLRSDRAAGESGQRAFTRKSAADGRVSWRLTKEARQLLQDWEADWKTVYNETDPASFRDAITRSTQANEFGAAVEIKSLEDYGAEGVQRFVSDDGLAGFAVKPDGDIVSVFSTPPGPKRRSYAMLMLALQQGGRKLDCFDTALPHIYSRMGFVATGRIFFSEEFAPPGWDYDLYREFNDGKPEVVFMKFDPDTAHPYQLGDGTHFGEDYAAAAASQEDTVILNQEELLDPKEIAPQIQRVYRAAYFTFLRRYQDLADQLTLSRTRIGGREIIRPDKELTEARFVSQMREVFGNDIDFALRSRLLLLGKDRFDEWESRSDPASQIAEWYRMFVASVEAGITHRNAMLVSGVSAIQQSRSTANRYLNDRFDLDVAESPAIAIARALQPLPSFKEHPGTPFPTHQILHRAYLRAVLRAMRDPKHAKKGSFTLHRGEVLRIRGTNIGYSDVTPEMLADALPAVGSVMNLGGVAGFSSDRFVSQGFGYIEFKLLASSPRNQWLGLKATDITGRHSEESEYLISGPFEVLSIDIPSKKQWLHSDTFATVTITPVLSPKEIASTPLLNQDPLDQVAFHGTPAMNFNEFDIAYVGTGEKNRDFGWGIYFSTAEGIGRFYKQTVRRAGSPGRVIEAEVPENEELLSWHDDWSAQPDGPKAKTEAALRAAGVTDSEMSGLKTGGDAYRLLQKKLGSQQAASMALDARGLTGLRYKAGTLNSTSRGFPPATNFVIWNNQAMAFANRIFSSDTGGGPRAQIALKEREAFVALMGANDLSSFNHELAHWFLQQMVVMRQLGLATPQMIQDLDTVVAWTGARSWQHLARPLAERTFAGKADKPHEIFARGWEVMLAEGRAPSPELEGLFFRFRGWVRQVYGGLLGARAKLGVELNDDIRRVYDRLFLIEMALDEVGGDAMRPLFETRPPEWSDAQWERYQRLWTKAQNAALARVTKRHLPTARRAMREQLAQAMDVFRTEAGQQVATDPGWAAIEFLKRGEGGLGLDREGLRQTLGPQATGLIEALLARPDQGRGRALVAPEGQEGLDPEWVAESVGLASAGDLVEAILQARTVDQIVQERVNREIEGQDQWSEEAVYADAEAAAVAEREALVLAELSALRQAIAQGPGLEDARREQAATGPLSASDAASAETSAETTLGLAVDMGLEAQQIADLQARQLAAEAQAEAARQGRAEARIATRALREIEAKLTAGTLKMKARQLVGETPAGRLRAERTAWTSTAARASKAARKLVAGRQFADAAVEIERQLLATYAAEELTRLQDEVDRGWRLVTRLRKGKALDKLRAPGFDGAVQVAQLMQRYDLRRSRPGDAQAVTAIGLKLQRQIEQAAREKGLEDLSTFVRRLREERADPIALPPWLEGGGPGTHWSKLPVVDLLGLFDTIRNIEHVMRGEATDIRTGKKVAIEQMAKEVAARLYAVNELLPPRRENSPRALSSEGLREMTRWADSMLLRTADMVDFMGGDDIEANSLRRYVLDPIIEGEMNYIDLMPKLTRPWYDALAKLDQRRMSSKVTIPELGVNGGISTIRYSEIFMMFLHTGTESNLFRLYEGFANSEDHKWTKAGIDKALSLLTPQEEKIAQEIWDAFEQLRPRVFEHEFQMTGNHPVQLERREFVSANGQKMSGGYMPAAYDGRYSDRARVLNEQADVQGLFGHSWTRTEVEHGHVKSRVQNYSAPLDLSMNVIPRHLDKVVYDLAMREAVSSAYKVLHHPEVKGAINKTWGKDYFNALEHMIHDAGRVRRQVPKGWQRAERVNNWVRSGVVYAGLGYRMSVGALQLTGWMPLLGEIGTTWTLAATSKFAAQGGWKFVQDRREASNALRTRGLTKDRELREMTSMLLGDKNRFKAKVDANTGVFIVLGDAIVSSIAWEAQRMKSMHEHGNPDRALREANRAISRTQGSSTVGEVSELMRAQGFSKWITLFGSFMSNIYARERRVGRLALGLQATEDVGGVPSRKVRPVAATWLLLTSTFLPATLDALLRGQGPDDDEREGLGWLDWALRNWVSFIVGPIPVLGSAVDAALHPERKALTSSPAARVFEPAEKIAKDMLKLFDEDEEFDLERVTRDVMLGLTMAQVAPLSQAEIWVDNFWESRELESPRDLIWRKPRERR